MAPPPFQRPSTVAVGTGAALSGAATTPNSTQLQQRAAAAAQFLAVERKISSREIQAMLEKNEAALRGWRGLQRQEPPKQNMAEHSEWVKRCMRLRQQIGARLEVLASLADKQIAQEDASEQQGEDKPAASSNNTNKNINGSAGNFGAPISQENPVSVGTAPMAVSARMNHQPPTEKQSQPPVKPVAMTSPSVFPDAPMPTSINVPQYGYTPEPASSMVIPNAFYQPSQSAPMTSSTQAFMPSSSSSMAMPSQGFPAMSIGPSFANNSYMSSANPTSQANAFMNQQQQALMMGTSAAATLGMNMAPNMMGVPPYMALAMQNNQVAMNMMQSPGMFNPAAVGMYPNASNGFPSMNNSQLPVDPFNAGMGTYPAQPGFQQPVFNTGVVPTGFDQFANSQSQMMNQMNGFPGMQDQQQMMMNAYAYGMSVMPQQQQQYMQPSATGVYPAAQSSLPQQQQQQQRTQQRQQETQQANDQQQTSGLPDSDQVLFDPNMNLFDEFPEDAFLQMQ